MGAGASAAEAVKGASAEDLTAALEQLPAADRDRFADALTSTINKKAAPFLAEYFKKQQDRTEEMLQDQEALLGICFDTEAAKKMQEELKAWWAAEAKPLLEKSFKNHDTKSNDVLDKEEAAAFFAHLVASQTQLSKTIMAMSIQASMQAQMQMFEGLVPPEDREAMKTEIEAQVKAAIEMAKADATKKEDAYSADKAGHDAAAFKVLDTNGDGTLQLSEFMAAFEPENEKNVELQIALGFLSKEEVELQKKMQEETEGCPQQ